ncbi:MAG: 16S rRNA processing protein RimM [Lachnospiraceae bacterium]|nr:16S rRNA processing protein RimM [Lachnospiraceae bacterium]
MEQFLRVGVITTTHGVKGEVKVFPTTDDPQRFKKLKEIWVENPKGRSCRKVESVKFFKQFVILKLEGIDDMDQAMLFKNSDLLVDREHAMPLAENENYIVDLIGLKVVSDEGEDLGVVTDVLQTGANDVYEIKLKSGKTVLFPAIRQCILDVNLEKGEVLAHVMEGLLDL